MLYPMVYVPLTFPVYDRKYVPFSFVGIINVFPVTDNFPYIVILILVFGNNVFNFFFD